MRKRVFALPPIFTLGKSGEDFFSDFREKNIEISAKDQELMLSDSFNKQITKGQTYYPGLLLGVDFLFSERISSNIKKIVLDSGGIIPSVELAPYLRLKISNQDIENFGLYDFVSMHEPLIKEGKSYIFSLNSQNMACEKFCTVNAFAERGWHARTGFVFNFPKDIWEQFEKNQLFGW